MTLNQFLFVYKGDKRNIRLVVNDVRVLNPDEPVTVDYPIPKISEVTDTKDFITKHTKFKKNTMYSNSNSNSNSNSEDIPYTTFLLHYTTKIDFYTSLSTKEIEEKMMNNLAHYGLYSVLGYEINVITSYCTYSSRARLTIFIENPVACNWGYNDSEKITSNVFYAIAVEKSLKEDKEREKEWIEKQKNKLYNNIVENQFVSSTTTVLNETEQTEQPIQIENLDNLDNLSIAKMKEALNTINKNIYNKIRKNNNTNNDIDDNNTNNIDDSITDIDIKFFHKGVDTTGYDDYFAYDMYDVIEAIRWLYNAVENGFTSGYKPDLIDKIRKLSED